MENQIKVLFKPMLTKIPHNPIPMRTMFGKIVKETQKAYLMELHCKPEPSTKCLHCNRKLTHPVSLLYGIGPICMGHFHMNPFNTIEELEEHYEELKNAMEQITWKGWVPKSQIKEMEIIKSEKYKVTFKYNNVTYNSIVGEDKLKKIKEKSEIISIEEVV